MANLRNVASGVAESIAAKAKGWVTLERALFLVVLGVLSLMVVRQFTCGPKPPARAPWAAPAKAAEPIVIRDTTEREVVKYVRVYIREAQPTLLTETRATLDSAWVTKDTTEAFLHVEYNRETNTFENINVFAEAKIRYKEIDRLVFAPPLPPPECPPAPPDDDDLSWFGTGSLVGFLASVILYLAL